jgi:O-antigen/teichoic acid export membrane protein
VNPVRRSLAYTFAEGYVVTALQFVATFFLARLLTPSETGIWAVAAVFAAIASTFRDFGVAEYLIQEKDLTDEKLRAALAVNIAVSWLMAICLLTASGWIADFYREPGVASVMRIQALNFLLVPFGAVTFAVFRRNLNYKPFFWASLLSNVASISTAIGFAWAGFGYMSLAYSSLAGVIVSVAVATIARPKGFPRLPALAGVRGVLNSGTHITGIYVFGQMGKSAPELIIGKVLGVAPVAFFSRANGLNELFQRLVLRAAVPVCLPYFAQEARDGKDVREGYLRAVSYLTVIGWPFFIFLAAMAYPAIRALYGSQWLASVPLAQILCAVAAIDVTYLLSKEVLIAQGDARRGNYLQVVTQLARIVGLFAAVPFGLPGACWGLLGAACAGAVMSQRALHERIGLTLAHMMDTCKASLAIGVVSAAPAALWAAFGRMDESNYIYVLALCSASFGALWLLCLRLLEHPLWLELRNFTARRRPRERPAQG